MTVKQLKYPKNPRTLIDRDDVMNYLFYLEDNGMLDNLEPSFLAYYVLADRLLNEVNNGGFEQYLINSSVATLPFLESSAKLVGNDELCRIVNDFVAEVNKRFDLENVLSRKKIEFDDEFIGFLSELDDRFCALDRCYDIEKIVRKYYQAHIPTNKIEIQIIKPRETDCLRYFVKNVKGISLQDATNAFIDYLNEFVGIKWQIEIMKFGEIFRINAIDDTNSINLDEVFRNFTEFECALKMLKFQEITIRIVHNGTETHDVSITPSGFEQDEFVMKRFCSMRLMSDSVFKVPICSNIILGFMSLTYQKYDLGEIEQTIIDRAKKQDNILLVYEDDCTVLRGKRTVIYEK